MGRWVDASLRATAWWALLTLVMESTNPAAVIADPAARLRWVLRAGAVTGLVLRLLDRPIPEWLGCARGHDAEPPDRR